jgi:putative aldouronate transport system permease protein
MIARPARIAESYESALRSEKWRRAKRMYALYLLFLVPLVTLIIFRYVPIYGLSIAFVDYRYAKGMLGSPWNNFEHFRQLFANPYFARLFRNTVIISVLKLVFGFPAPIILALIINEVQSASFKRTVQSISYLPHFLSWVVLSGIIIEMLSPQRGIVGYIYTLLGMEAPVILYSQGLFRPMLVVTAMWQGVGWGAVIYLAAIAGINPELYESATVDGANRLQMAVRITVPSLIPVIVVLFILNLGYLMEAGFDQILNLYNPLVWEVADIIDTFVYRKGILDRQYDYATAVGLFKSLVGVCLLVAANMIIRRFSEYGIW